MRLAMRKASPDDIQQLVAMMTEFYAESAYTLNQRRATDAFTALLADERLGHVWFIQSESESVGYIVVTLCYRMEFGGLSAFVDDLFVRPAFRGAGLGTGALAEVRTLCAAHGIRAIHVETGRENVAAKAAYRRAGFVDTDRLHLTLGLDNPAHHEDVA